MITKIAGGLGNQLFQYAMARRLALHHKAELLLDISHYRRAEKCINQTDTFSRKFRLFEFRVVAREASAAEIASLHDRYRTTSPRDRFVRLLRRRWPRLLWQPTHIVERQYRFQPEALNFPDNIYLTGFWQSEKYFADIAPLIRREYELVDKSIVRLARQRVCALKKKFRKVVSLHVRRGDLVHAHETLQKKNLVHGAPVGLDYIQKAIAEFGPDCCFFVFSDTLKDVEWCKDRLQAKHLEFSTCESELWDFVAMSSCDHHIIANSTFGWWSAWLNATPNRRVVAPRQWSSPEAKVEMFTDDLIPPDWDLI